MTELKETRLQAIRRVVNNCGIEDEGKIFMPLWDLAYKLNNSYHAGKFVNRKKYPKNKYITEGCKEFALDSWELHDLFRGIRHAVRDTEFTLKRSPGNKTEYLISYYVAPDKEH